MYFYSVDVRVATVENTDSVTSCALFVSVTGSKSVGVLLPVLDGKIGILLINTRMTEKLLLYVC